MSLAETLQNRKNLERTGKLKHDSRFDDMEKHARSSILLLIAILTAGAYAVGIDAYYRMKYSGAQPGEIKALSEMTKQEIKALNIAKAPTEKRHVSK